ncbi:hypothetical protein EYF80_049390 [Liparis tanakae]|uniref:Uncharacterized protein n=1 Tax=Liparis tanakae TaxID=230148 RepID=A0A4Z2FGY2_9TELE|nr:hypothetical protein EYF80_049390 [Liparis tanakae]
MSARPERESGVSPQRRQSERVTQTRLTFTTLFWPSWGFPSGPTGSRITQYCRLLSVVTSTTPTTSSATEGMWASRSASVTSHSSPDESVHDVEDFLVGSGQPLVSSDPLLSSGALKVQKSLKTQRRVGVHDLERGHDLEPRARALDRYV